MGQVSDEILMAYADGELSPEETEALEALLSRDATLRMRLKPFVVTRREIANTYDPTLEEPVPQHLVAAVLRAPASPGARKPAPADAESWLRRALGAVGATLFPSGAPLATAASVAAMVCVGALAGWLVAQSPALPEPGLIVTAGSGLAAAGALAHALESAPSGTASAAEAHGAAIVPVMSFRTESQGICRQYRISDTRGEPDYAGLACRTENGVWRVAVHVEAAKQATAQIEPGDAYQTATGPGVPAVDAIVDTMISGHALGRDEERALLENGWRPASS